MTTDQTQSQSATIPLFLYFWLPAGKDAFGFAGWKEAKLNVFKDYYRELYTPIGLHFIERCGNLEFSKKGGKNGFSFDALSGIQDTRVGLLRKVACPFSYNSDLAKDFCATSALKGEFCLWSSGLYSFRFDVPANGAKTDARAEDSEGNKTPGEATRAAVRGFCDRFFRDVINPLFDLEWQKYLSYVDRSGHLVLTNKSSPDTPQTESKEYSGILTYYQLDYLYDSVFDAEAVPQIFFSQATTLDGESAEPDGKDKTNIDKMRNLFRLDNILRSAAVISWGTDFRQYFLLDKDRKDYSLRGAYKHKKECYLHPNGEQIRALTYCYKSAQPGTPKSGLSNDHFNQLAFFYARLTYSAMEQFIRIAVSFGLNIYSDGLNCARKTVLLQNMLAKENMEPKQLYLESHDGSQYQPLVTSLSRAEMYYELINTKLPSLLLLNDLLNDISEVITPQQAPYAQKTVEDCFIQTPEKVHELPCAYAVEFDYGRKTLGEALRQLGRKCEAIREETKAVRHLMERSGDRQVLTELTDTRKIHEIAAEDRVKVEISPDQWNRLTVAIGYMQVGTAISLAVLGGAIWLAQHILTLGDSEIYREARSITDFVRDKPSLITALVALLFMVYKPTRALALAVIVGATLYNLWSGIAQNSEGMLGVNLSIFTLGAGMATAYLFWQYFEGGAGGYGKTLGVKALGTGRDFANSIYDFANLKYPINKDHVLRLFEQWKNSGDGTFDFNESRFAPRLFGKNISDDIVECRTFGLLSEMPSAGIEKRKYSFATPPTGKGENYTLHVEIEITHSVFGNLKPSDEAFLTDIRLAVRTPSEQTKGWHKRVVTRGFNCLRRCICSRIVERKDIDTEVKRLVYYFCHKILVTTTDGERKLHTLLRKQFAFADEDQITDAKSRVAALL